MKTIYMLIPSPDTLIFLAVVVIPVFGTLLYLTLKVVVSRRNFNSKAISTLFIAYLIVGLVFGAEIYPKLYISKIAVGDSYIEIRAPGLIPLYKKISLKSIAKAYVCRINECLEGLACRLQGLSIGRFSIGYFKLGNGKLAYVASINVYEDHLILELKDRTYVILRPNNFKNFTKTVYQKMKSLLRDCKAEVEACEGKGF